MRAVDGNTTSTQALLGRVLAPFVRSRTLGDRPFPRSAPTDPDYKIVDGRDFDAEKKRLSALVDRFVGCDVEGTDGVVHSFFGRLTGEEWGRLMFKHLDQHLRQFGV